MYVAYIPLLKLYLSCQYCIFHAIPWRLYFHRNYHNFWKNIKFSWPCWNLVSSTIMNNSRYSVFSFNEFFYLKDKRFKKKFCIDVLMEILSQRPCVQILDAIRTDYWHISTAILARLMCGNVSLYKNCNHYSKRVAFGMIILAVEKI